MSILQDKNKEIANLIRDGSAFVNPLADHLSSYQSAAMDLSPDDIATKINDVCDQLNIPHQCEPSDITELQTKITNLTNQVNSFKQHTDQLSGIDLTGNKNIVALFDLTAAAQDIIKDCDQSQAPEDNPYYKVFGSILNAPKTIDTMIKNSQVIQNIKDYFDTDFFDDLITESDEEKIRIIKEKLELWKETYDNLRNILKDEQDADEDGYIDVQKELAVQILTEQLGSFIGQSCANNIVNKIRSPELAKAIKTLKK